MNIIKLLRSTIEKGHPFLIIVFMSLLMFFQSPAYSYFRGNIESAYSIDEQIAGYNIAYIDIDFNFYYNWHVIPFAGGGVKTWYCSNTFRDLPFRSIYSIYSGIEYKGFYGMIWHVCNHPTYSPTIKNEWERNKFGYDMTMIKAGYKWDIQ